MLWSDEARNTEECQLLQTIARNVPIIVTDMHECVIGVSTEWCAMCQYSSGEAFGRTPGILQGPMTNLEAARDLSVQIRRGRAPVFTSLVNYKKDGTPFVNHLYAYPLGDLFVAETYAETAMHRVEESRFSCLDE